MFRYRLDSPDGDDLGEATYAQMIRRGEEIHFNVRGGWVPYPALVQVPAIGARVEQGSVPSGSRSKWLPSAARLYV